MATIRIGISGWRYKPWRGPFYPADLPQRAELEYASRLFSTIEINGSFYSLQRPESYARWYGETPAGFVFTIKAPRYITHVRRLREVEEPLANFFASGMFNLREKLGPILWQFPPSFRYDERLEPFLSLLPHDTGAARVLARRRGAWMKGRVRLAIDAERPLRHAIEIRHERSKPPSSEPRDVYGFFDNTDVKLRAPFDAQSLMRKLGLAGGANSHAGRPRTSAVRETRVSTAR